MLCQAKIIVTAQVHGSMVQGSRLGSDIKRFEDIEAW